MAVQHRLSASEQDVERALSIGRTGRLVLAGHRVEPFAWGDPALPKLVRYHLHYLDAARALILAAPDGDRTPSHDEALRLVERWARENSQGGEGWEPYAVAVRLQHLSTIAAALGPESPAWLAELMATHARYLAAFPERHLEANHLLKDWCALALACAVLEGDEVFAWRERAHRELRRELDQQLCLDGGHYERSPMYHSLVLADLLDLRDLLAARGQRELSIERDIRRMAPYLRDVLHPDGDIPLFNDAVLGQAPKPVELLARAGEPGPPQTLFDGEDSGLTAIRSEGELLIVDRGPIGPDHQPGHAHSDTLSFELSVGGGRAVVNSGMDGYQSQNRPYFRSAVAHNVVTVDGEGPDELWASFRVGGRNRLLSRHTEQRDGVWILDGVLQAFQGWRHARRLVYFPGAGLLILDRVSRLKAAAEVRSRVRLARPAVEVTVLAGTRWEGEGRYAPRFGSVEAIKEVGALGSGREVLLCLGLCWTRERLSFKGDGANVSAVLDGREVRVGPPISTPPGGA